MRHIIDGERPDTVNRTESRAQRLNKALRNHERTAALLHAHTNAARFRPALFSVAASWQVSFAIRVGAQRAPERILKAAFGLEGTHFLGPYVAVVACRYSHRQSRRLS
jgi:hypothetical protein